MREGINPGILDKRRKRVAKILEFVFYIVLITGILIWTPIGLQKFSLQIYRVLKLVHLISGLVMTVLVFMHLKLEKRWESFQKSRR